MSHAQLAEQSNTPSSGTCKSLEEHIQVSIHSNHRAGDNLAPDSRSDGTCSLEDLEVEETPALKLNVKESTVHRSMQRSQGYI